MAYARLRGLRADLDEGDTHPLESSCADANRVLDDLHVAGFDLSAFRLDVDEPVVDRSAWLRSRLDAILDYMDLFAGLP
jgi:hypothetical protein